MSRLARIGGPVPQVPGRLLVLRVEFGRDGDEATIALGVAYTPETDQLPRRYGPGPSDEAEDIPRYVELVDVRVPWDEGLEVLAQLRGEKTIWYTVARSRLESLKDGST